MSITIEAPVKFEYYYDSHPTEDDLMGEAPLHRKVNNYLDAVVAPLAELHRWMVLCNVNIYGSEDPGEYPLAPDLAVIKDVTVPERLEDYPHSWAMARDHLPPP
jgi:hypothetical protein